MFRNLEFSCFGKAANCMHQTLKQFHFFDLLPLVSSECWITGHTLTGRPSATFFTGWDRVTALAQPVCEEFNSIVVSLAVALMICKHIITCV